MLRKISLIFLLLFFSACTAGSSKWQDYQILLLKYSDQTIEPTRIITVDFQGTLRVRSDNQEEITYPLAQAQLKKIEQVLKQQNFWSFAVEGSLPTDSQKIVTVATVTAKNEQESEAWVTSAACNNVCSDELDAIILSVLDLTDQAQLKQ